jgi:putative CocE/NonD family hydrolase
MTRVVKNVRIPMRDGVSLAADLYLPEDHDGPLPVVMEYIPYRKDEVTPGSRFYYDLPKHGYVVCRVDIRGTGASEGQATDEYVLQEQLDGYDAIEWLASQPFCDGNVNMMGISYGGFTSLQVATHQPPHLKTIIPMYFTDDRYTDDCHYRGGLLRKYYDVGHYGNFMIAYNALPPYPEYSGAEWAAIWEEHLARNEPYLLKWLAHPTNDAYWRHGSVGDIPEKITCPVFMIGGWRDGYTNCNLRLYEALQVPKRVLIGPWSHAVPDISVPGPRIDHLREVARWLDYWCKDAQNGADREPPVVVYVQHTMKPDPDALDTPGAWRAETEWPIPGARERTLFLEPEGNLGHEPGEDGSEEYTYVPDVGVTGGLWSAGVPFGQPGDQRIDEALSLTYTSPPLAEPFEIIGNAHTVLHVSTTARVIGFNVNLSDVAPDGSSMLIAKGMLNGTRRNSLSDPEPLVPGERYELEIPIDATAWRLETGHRIRVTVSNADWPNVWPTPEPAISTIYHGVLHPSRIVLPVVPDRGSAEPPRFEPSPLVLTRHTDDAAPPTWEVADDVLGRTRTVRMKIDRSERITPTTRVDREFESTFQVARDDPASASAYGRHTSRITRPTGVVESRSDVTIQATATHFHVLIDLAVRANGVLHHQRQWTASVERMLL